MSPWASIFLLFRLADIYTWHDFCVVFLSDHILFHQTYLQNSTAAPDHPPSLSESPEYDNIFWKLVSNVLIQFTGCKSNSKKCKLKSNYNMYNALCNTTLIQMNRRLCIMTRLIIDKKSHLMNVKHGSLKQRAKLVLNRSPEVKASFKKYQELYSPESLDLKNLWLSVSLIALKLQKLTSRDAIWEVGWGLSPPLPSTSYSKWPSVWPHWHNEALSAQPIFDT